MGRWLIKPVIVLIITFLILHHFHRFTNKAGWLGQLHHNKYTEIFSDAEMKLIHEARNKGVYLDNVLTIPGPRDLKNIEHGLEDSLSAMFEQNISFSTRQLRNMSEVAWKKASGSLAETQTKSEIRNVLVYNRISKSGSSMLMSHLYKLRLELDYLVIRGKYHSYRYFSEPDRGGLGDFLSAGSSVTRFVYVQHQFFLDYEPHHQSQPLYMNLMREPLDQFISWYFYKRTAILYHRDPDDIPADEIETIKRSLEECILENNKECMYSGHRVPSDKQDQLNYRIEFSAHYFHPSVTLLHFCGHAIECLELASKQALDLAKNNVETKFAVVGVLEYMDETSVVLENCLPEFFRGISLHIIKENGNLTNKNTMKKEKLSSKAREIMKVRLASEYELYNFVVHKLMEKYDNIKANLSCF